MKLAFIFGTRPEIIKTSPLVRAAQKQKIPFILVHSGQHYSYEMDKVFFKELGLPKADYNLEVGSGSHGAMTAKILSGVEEVLMKEQPDCVLVQGDTNTVLAGALAAVKLHIPIAHIEAGLRSYDRRMPEEHNRILADHMADFLFCPTKETAQIVKAEGIPAKRIFVTGNTVVDAAFQNLEIAKGRGDYLKAVGLTPRGYLLVTAHRPENVDHEKSLGLLVETVVAVGKALSLPVYWPVHPRTKKQLEVFHVTLPESVRLVDPVGFFEFLQLESGAAMIATDSGGVQEEACILRVPCLTMRDTTERPETVTVGGSVLVGINPKRAATAARLLARRKRNWANPFGDGRSSFRMLSILKHSLK